MKPKTYLNFRENYNNKLSCDYFTTIRNPGIILEKNLRVGDIVDIQIDHNHQFLAVVVAMENIDFDTLTASHKTLLMLDTGYAWTCATCILKKIYHVNNYVIITLKHQP